MKENLKSQKGITLIALVVTIIVLIILAGVSINLVFGEYGIITRAQDAKDDMEVARVKEEIQLDIIEKQLYNKGSISESEIVEILEKKGTLSEEENLLDRILTLTEGGYEIKVSDIYSGKIKEDEVVVKEITASDVEADASYIGKYVNYGGAETYKGVKWRIFNAENGQIQLIADNYIKSDVIPEATSIKISGSKVYTEDNRITLLNYINTTSNWSSFVAETGAIVTGGPTLEQFKNSYNRTHGASSEATVKEIFIAKSAAMEDGLEGYYVGTSENPTTFYITGLNTTEMENLYVINYTPYWLGSASANDNYLMLIGHDGHVDCYANVNGYSDDYTSVGLRPLVILPSGTTLVEQKNGSYNVQI